MHMSNMTDVSADSINWFGRTLDYNGIRYFDYSASGFDFVFYGKKAVCSLVSDADAWPDVEKCFIGVYCSALSSKKDAENLDFWKNLKNEPDRHFMLGKKNGEYVLFESENPELVHIRVLKLSEAAFGYAGFSNLKIDGILVPCTIKKQPLNIQFIGDSITCGYGIDGVCNKDEFNTAQERADKAYAFLTAKKLNAAFQSVCWSGIGIISCYVPPENDEADTKILMPLLLPYKDRSLSLRQKIEPEVFQADSFKPDVVVINLGTNDSSYTRNKTERINAFINGYLQLLETVHRSSPKAAIVATLGVMGQDLCPAVEDAVNRFKKDFPQAAVSVLTLEEQDEKDGIATDFHPSATTHAKVAEKLAEHIKMLNLSKS